jgi:hypothetical protein
MTVTHSNSPYAFYKPSETPASQRRFAQLHTSDVCYIFADDPPLRGRDT